MLYKMSNRLYMKLYPSFLRSLGVRVNGMPTFISPSASFDSSDYSLIELGDKCVISGGVRLLTHDYSITRVAFAKGVHVAKEFRTLKPVSIGKNAFIGTRSIIMPGVQIGKNSIIGAGSVVTRDVGNNLIFAGNPARRVSSIDEYWLRINENCEYIFSE